MSALHWKFLARGAIGPISRVAWPRPAVEGAPGEWVEAGKPLDPCRAGVHVCAAHQLAFWLHDELWEVEVDGEVADGHDCVMAGRGRLRREVEAWRGELGRRFAEAAAAHAVEVVAQANGPERQRVAGYLEAAQGLAASGLAVGAGYVAAVAVARLHADGDGIDAGYHAERTWQSGWLHARLVDPQR